MSASHDRRRFVILGLSITSSWGNGHATTYRGLVRELAAMGHEVVFLERDVEWYARHRDLPRPPFATTALYGSVDELKDRFTADVAQADCVIVGSYVPEGTAIGDWVLDTARGVTAFYDIDTPVTMAALERRRCEYLRPEQIARYNLYLSFTGGPFLKFIERRYGSPRALPLYCSFDPDCYAPDCSEASWDLGYMGTYSDDRQPLLDRLALEAARMWHDGRMVVAGPSYPDHISWPSNVARIEHLPPDAHRGFYCTQRYTLNITRADMVRAGYSPSVRLFEAAGCGTPVISDNWAGLSSFFEPGREILVSTSASDTLHYLREVTDEERRTIGARARQRALREHTAAHRAQQLDGYVTAAFGPRGQ